MRGSRIFSDRNSGEKFDRTNDDDFRSIRKTHEEPFRFVGRSWMSRLGGETDERDCWSGNVAHLSQLRNLSAESLNQKMPSGNTTWMQAWLSKESCTNCVRDFMKEMGVRVRWWRGGGGIAR